MFIMICISDIIKLVNKMMKSEALHSTAAVLMPLIILLTLRIFNDGPASSKMSVFQKSQHHSKNSANNRGIVPPTKKIPVSTETTTYDFQSAQEIIDLARGAHLTDIKNILGTRNKYSCLIWLIRRIKEIRPYLLEN